MLCNSFQVSFSENCLVAAFWFWLIYPAGRPELKTSDRIASHSDFCSTSWRWYPLSQSPSHLTSLQNMCLPKPSSDWISRCLNESLDGLLTDKSLRKWLSFFLFPQALHSGQGFFQIFWPHSWQGFPYSALPQLCFCLPGRHVNYYIYNFSAVVVFLKVQTNHSVCAVVSPSNVNQGMLTYMGVSGESFSVMVVFSYIP